MKNTLLSLGILALMASCQNELYRDNAKTYEADQAAYVSTATTQVFAEEGVEKEVRELSISLARKPTEAYTVEVKTGLQSELDIYNKKNGTDYVMLPAEMYDAPKTVTFAANTAMSSYPIKLKNLKFSPGKVYAVPVTISGDCVVPGQKTGVLTIDPLTITKVGKFAGTSASRDDMWPDVLRLKQWTIEIMVRRAAYYANNRQIVYSVGNKSAIDQIFTRFGDVVIEPNQLQMKSVGSNLNVEKSEFVAKSNEWYMLSFVYDGKTNYIYVNGKRVYANILRENNEYTMKGLGISGHNEYVREVRLYNVARTQQQIESTAWKTADYNDDSLLAYYPLNGKKLDPKTGEITEDDTKIWDWSKSGLHMERPSTVSFVNDSNGEPFVFPVGVR